eukprot:snap_masked-scaffold_3-processed-gene-2.21-mRNA-1 protein AED:1.00 eAED:1.00 QI:0/-1/0/0/-1/1/1/0/329
MNRTLNLTYGTDLSQRELKIEIIVRMINRSGDTYSVAQLDVTMDFQVLILNQKQSIKEEISVPEKLSLKILSTGKMLDMGFEQKENETVLRRKLSLYDFEYDTNKIGKTADGKHPKCITKDSIKISKVFESMLKFLQDSFQIDLYSLTVSHYDEFGNEKKYFKIRKVSSDEFERNDFDAMFIQPEYISMFDRLLNLHRIEQAFAISKQCTFEADKLLISSLHEPLKLFKDVRLYPRFNFTTFYISLGYSFNLDLAFKYTSDLISFREYCKKSGRNQIDIYIGQNLERTLGLTWSIVSTYFEARNSGWRVNISIDKWFSPHSEIKSYLKE